MKIKETILNLLKVSLVLMVTLFNIQAMAAPPVTIDDSEDYEQFEGDDLADADDFDESEDNIDELDIDND